MFFIQFDFRPEYDFPVAVIVFRNIHQTALAEIRINGKIFSLENTDLRLDQFAEVVGQYGSRHTNGDTVTAQHEETGDLYGQHNGLLASAVVRVHKLSQVVVEKDLSAQFGKSALDVTRSGGGTPCNGVAVVALLDDVVLFVGKNHQSVPDGGVSVGVIVHHIADDIGSFVCPAVVDLFQSPEDTALNGFETVVHIWDGTVFDHIRSIFQKVLIDHGAQIGIVTALVDSFIALRKFTFLKRDHVVFVFVTHICLPSGSS